MRKTYVTDARTMIQLMLENKINVRPEADYFVSWVGGGTEHNESEWKIKELAHDKRLQANEKGLFFMAIDTNVHSV